MLYLSNAPLSMEQTYVRKTFHSNIAHYFIWLNFVNTLCKVSQMTHLCKSLDLSLHDVIGLTSHTKLSHTNRIDVTKH